MSDDYHLAYQSILEAPEITTGDIDFIVAVYDPSDGKTHQMTLINFLATRRKITTVNANYTVLTNDDIVRANANTFTITLPTAMGISGKIYQIKNAGGGTVTLEADGSQTIDGQPNFTLAPTDNMVVMSNGVGWDVL